MGFLSSLLRVAAPIVSGFLGGGAVQAFQPQPAAVAAPTGESVRKIGGRGGAALVRGGIRKADIGPSVVKTIEARVGVRAGCPVGGSKNRIMTIVQTMDADGNVLCEEELEGRPFLMRKDFVIAKRVRKLITKAKSKIAPARREESDQTKLVKAIVGRATQNVLTSGTCPTNGNG